jgi:holo-[acyl-carrier protein] synthase
MALGLGTDILNLQRFRRVLETDADVFLRKVYTAKEREQAAGRNDPFIYYATRFSGKEAVYKCIRLEPVEIRFNEIEILDKESGAPTVTLSGSMRDAALTRGIETILVSLSSDTDYAIAVACAQGSPAGS